MGLRDLGYAAELLGFSFCLLQEVMGCSLSGGWEMGFFGESFVESAAIGLETSAHFF